MHAPVLIASSMKRVGERARLCRRAPLAVLTTVAVSACGSPDGAESRRSSDSISLEAADSAGDSANEGAARQLPADAATPARPSSSPETVDSGGGSTNTGPALRLPPDTPAPSARVAIDNPPIWIEGGTFVMGTDESYPTWAPAHEVTLSSFWIQQHEVTNAEFRRFRPNHRSVDGPDDLPVEYVQWQEAMAYAAWLGGSLPTEAQWEYAARGKEGRTYPWGEATPTCALARHFDCLPRGAIPVMSHPGGATPDGVYDLAGNVAEWVLDRYGSYRPEPVRDPVGPDTGDRRVLRGGGWQMDTTYLRGLVRNSRPEQNAPAVVDEMGGIGFRVVWSGEAGPDSIPSSRPR